MPVSVLEEKFNTCAVCGRKFDKDRALKVHKHKMGCEELPDNPDIVAKLESYHIIPESSISIKDIVQTPELIKEVVVQPVKSEVPPEVKPIPKEVPLVAPAKLGIKAVLVGSSILLEGDVFLTVNGTYQMIKVSNLKGTVVKRFTDPQNITFIELKGEDNNIYTLPEHVILPPNPATISRCQILRLGPEKPFSGAPKDLDIPDREAFIKCVKDYAKARDAKTDATKEYNKVDKDTRPVIVKYVEAVGKPKEGNDKGSCVVDSGYEVHYAYKYNPPTHTRDDDIIVDYLLEKGYKHALMEVTEYKIRDEVWEHLKTSGAIPKEFVEAHDYDTPNEPSRTLLVTKV